MSFWRRLGYASGAYAMGFGVLCSVSVAQELTQREKDMMVVIEALKERVSALEEKAAVAQPQQAGGQLVERVEALENAVDENTMAKANDFRVFWKDGLHMETTDGQARIEIGGRVHNDWYWFDQDRKLQDAVDLEDGAEFRRARLSVSGTLYENLKFKAEYDFADGDSDLKEVYMELGGVPGVQNIRVGNFKEPFSMEELTSDNDITFMERALSNVFAPSYNTGAMVHGAFLGKKKQERMTAALGIFRTSDDYGNDADDGGYSGTIRVTGLPWYEEDGRKLLHLGAAYTHRNPDNTIRIRQRPEAHGAERFLDTGNFDAEAIDAYVVESALVYGPFSLQGEYSHTTVDTRYVGDRDFDGYYVQASYLLTGERRPYKNASGFLGRVIPNKNFRFHGEERGWGAWELALRYSSLDLNDGHTSIWDRALGRTSQIRGGMEDNFTVGLNWHLNPSARIMWNYVHANLDSDVYEGDLNTFQTRFQLAF